MPRRVIGSFVACVVAACGRIGFAPIDDTADDAYGSNADAGDAGGELETIILPAVADTTLNSFAPTLNYGGATAFNVRSDAVSTFVGLIHFELPATTGSVTSATLLLTTSNQAFAAGRIELARVREAWDEGTQNGGSGVASFGLRQTAVPWTNPGCGPGSRDSSTMGELQPLEPNTRYEVALAVEVAQEWLLDPAKNHGIALIAASSGNDTVTFFSRESAMGPELVLQVMR